MIRRSRKVAPLICLATWLGAIGKFPQAVQREKDVKHVIALARAVPPEFGADALITLVEAGLIGSETPRRDLLRDAFALAGKAQESAQLVSVAPPSSALASALPDVTRKGLDRVSLQSRVVQLLVGSDSDLAREFHASIGLPDETTFSCNRRFVFAFSRYDAASRAVADSISDPGELRTFLLRECDRLKSGSELSGFLNLVSQSGNKLNVADFARIGQALAMRLPDLHQDRLTFENSASGALRSLARFAATLPLNVRMELILGAKLWVVRATNGGMCKAAPATPQASPVGQEAPQMLPSELFNSYLGTLSIQSAPVTIRQGEVQSHYIGQAPMADVYLRDRRRYANMEELLFRDVAQVSDGAEINRWQRELEGCIRAIAAWQTERPDAEYYLEKAALLQRAMALRHIGLPGSPVPGSKSMVGTDGLNPTKLLAEFLDGDVATGVYRERRAVWFAPVLYALRSSEHDDQMDGLLTSARSPVLQIYGTLGLLLSSAHRVYH